MSKLAEVAERLAETRRWLDQEASRLAARLDQLEKRAPKAIQTAHRLIDDQLRGLEETERMVQQWLNATAEPGAGKGAPQGAASSAAAASLASLETLKERPPVPVDAARAVVDEQNQYVEKLERALQRMASELPEPHAEPATQVNESAEGAPAVDSRPLLDEQGAAHAHGAGLESALQTLANMPRPRLMPFGSVAPPAMEPVSPKAEDASNPQLRKLGVVRVA